MRLFHIASNKNAETILKEGFRNGTGYYLTDRLWEGVRISDKPFNDEHLSDTNTLFAIEIPEDVINEFEVVGTGKVTREFLVPAALLNHYESLVVTDDY